METVDVTRRVHAPREDVADAIDDWGAFVRAAGFDDVAVDGDRIRVANQVGVAELELVLDVVDRADAYFAYEQRDGVFDEMWTAYRLSSTGDGATDVTAETRFALGVPVFGGVLDATVVGRQRRRELDAQLDWLADTAP